MALPLPQLVEEHNVYKKELSDRGNGLFAAEDLSVKSQVIFVARPLLMVLDTARLRSYCDYCFKSPSDNSTWTESERIESLKKCTGCDVLRFCGRQCQRHAWSHYHKFECKIYANQPHTLPTLNRAILRLLKQHEAELLPDGEWEQLHTLEDHYEKLLQSGGKKWQDLLVVAKKIQKDSGGKRTLEMVLRLVCLVVVNSFTLTSPTFDPIGLALHPKSALFNHSCDPNAFVRFDIPPVSGVERLPPFGSISVHTLRPVTKNEELTISYIDTTSPFEKRQEELKERYFFKCSCTLCSQGPSSFLDDFKPSHANLDERQFAARAKELKEIQASVERYLGWIKTTPGIEHQQLDGIRNAMKRLAVSDFWSLHRFPWPQLRKLLFLGLLDVEKYDEAFIQSGILLRKVYPVPYKDEHHPIRLMETWTLFQLCRSLLGTKLSQGNRKDAQADALANLSCVVICEVDRLLSVGGRVKGQFERIVDEALHTVKSEPYVWGDYHERVRNSVTTWAWLDSQLDSYLLKEEGLKPQDVKVDVTRISWDASGQESSAP